MILFQTGLYALSCNSVFWANTNNEIYKTLQYDRVPD